MKGKSFVVVLFASALVSSLAYADPSVSARLLGFNNDGNRKWVVEIDPDENLFFDPDDNPDKGTGGSLAVELAFDIDGSELVDAVVNTTDWPFETVGFNPFTNGLTNGLWIDEDNGLIILFAALGSEFLTSPEPVPLLTLETQGGAKTTLRWGELASGDPYFGAVIAQAGEEFFPQSGMLMSVPEPASIALSGWMLATIWFIRRREH